MNVDNLTEATTQLAITWGARVLGVLFALFIASIIAGAVRRSMMRGFERSNFDATLARFFSNLARYAILIAAGLGCLGVFGIETTSFAAVIAAGGLAIGLAFQGTLSNFASGVMLLVFRPFKVGDVINAAGVIGAVEEIELFTVELTTPDNRRIIVPNSVIFGGTIENITHHPERRVDVGVGTAYSADLDTTRKILEDAIAKVAGGLSEPEPQVFLSELGASSIDWKLRLWCKTEDYWDVRQTLMRDCKVTLDAAGIGIPFPQMDVHVDKLS